MHTNFMRNSKQLEPRINEHQEYKKKKLFLKLKIFTLICDFHFIQIESLLA